MGATAPGAARRAGQALPFGKGVAAGEARRRDDGQAFAESREAFGEVDEVVGDGFFRDADQPGKVVGRMLSGAQRVGQCLADGGLTGGGGVRFGHRDIVTSNS